MKTPDDGVGGSPDAARSRAHDAPGRDSGSQAGAKAASASNGADADSAGSEASAALIRSVLRLFEDLYSAANSLIEVYADRIRLSVREKLVGTVIAASVAVCTTVFMTAAALAVLWGIRGGLTALWGREWLGDLAGGALALALTAGAGALYLRLSTRRELETLRAKYERIHDEHEKRRAGAIPAEDGQGVARAPGSAGVPGDRGFAAARERGRVDRD